MKIYAVKDRLIGYFLTPFVAPSDKEVMAGISQEINRPDNLNAIAQSPHHFEIHTLGEIDDEGNLTARKEFICDVATLIRARRESTERATSETPRTPRENGNGLEHRAQITGTAGEAVPAGTKRDN